MRRLALALMFTALAASSALADESCKAQASDKKLAGAALTSFMKKCDSDAASMCNTSGAAKDSFTKKCVKNATGT